MGAAAAAAAAAAAPEQAALCILRPVRGLDARCERLLWALHDYRQSVGYWPRYAELAALAGLKSRGGIHHHRKHLAYRHHFVSGPARTAGKASRGLALDYKRVAFARIDGKRVILERAERMEF